MSYFFGGEDGGDKVGSPPRSNEVNHLVATIENSLLNKTHNIETPTFVRRVLGPLKSALEMKGRIVYQVDLDVGRLVVLAVCKTLLVHTIVASNLRTSDLLVDAT